MRLKISWAQNRILYFGLWISGTESFFTVGAVLYLVGLSFLSLYPRDATSWDNQKRLQTLLHAPWGGGGTRLLLLRALT